MGQNRERDDYIKAEIKLSPTNLVQLADGTFVGDPIRVAIEREAAKEGREIFWDTLKVWTNKQPHDHNGITIRVFVRASEPETKENDERADD